ncbi:hypothetical protein C8F01DRAFT_1306320 [Mycena amicta]|nr:hypothetical protein C8F01DRAFT_1306320 [Mycena amicta]
MLCQQTHRPTLDHDVARHSADNTSRLTSHARSVVLEPSNVLSPTHGTLAALKIDLATASDGVPTERCHMREPGSARASKSVNSRATDLPDGRAQASLPRNVGASAHCELSSICGCRESRIGQEASLSAPHTPPDFSLPPTSQMSPPSTVDRGALYAHRMPIIQLVVLFDPGLPANKEISISTHTRTTAFPQVALIQIHESEVRRRLGLVEPPAHARPSYSFVASHSNAMLRRIRNVSLAGQEVPNDILQGLRTPALATDVFIPRGGQRAGRPYELHVATPRRKLATIGLGLYPLRTQAHGWLARVHNVDELKQDAAEISNVTMMEGRRGWAVATLLNANPGRRMGGAHIV